MEKKKTKRVPKRSLPPGVELSVRASQEKQAADILVLDLRDVCSFTDFFIIMNGNTARQNVAIYENIERELKKNSLKPLGVEGKEHGEWILMDYGSFIVHVFSRHAREYYSLEKLWGDASKIGSFG